MEPAGSGFELITWQGWSVTGSISAMLILLITILLWLLPFPRDAVYEQLAEGPGREDIRSRLGANGLYQRFVVSMRRFGSWLERWFGRRWSGQAFERCVAIAFAFPVALFLVATILAGYSSGEVGIGEILLFIFGAVMVSLAIGWLFRLAYWFLRRMWHSIGGDNELAEIVTRIALGAFAVVFAFAISFAIASSLAGEVSDVGTVFFAIMGGFAFALAFAIAFAFAGIWAFLIALILVTIIALTMAKDFAFFLLLFFVILPVLNAFVDWISWAITRLNITLMQSVPAGFQGAGLTVFIVIIDILAAIILVVALAALLPIGLELADLLLSVFGRDGFDWRTAAVQAVNAPWGEGLFVTGMLLTPIIPTLTMLTIAIGSPFLAFTPGRSIAVDGLPAHHEPVDGHDEDGDRKENADVSIDENMRNFASRIVYLSRLWYLPAFAAAVALFLLISWTIAFSDISIATFLYDLALCSTSWMHGQCNWI